MKKKQPFALFIVGFILFLIGVSLFSRMPQPEHIEALTGVFIGTGLTVMFISVYHL